MRSDDIVNVMYREKFPRFSQSACAQRFFNSEKAMQGNKIRRQIAFAELRSATSSVGSRRKKLLDDHVKQVVNRHDKIENMKFTRQGRILFTTKDPICAVQLLSLIKFMDTDISTDVIWENICSRFLIFDIPVNTPMEEVAEEIQVKNYIDVVEMRRFLKLGERHVSGTDYSPGEEHVGPCQGPEKCINCKGPHNAKSNSCPAYIKEKKILELKCWNLITTSEARKVFHLQNMKYSEAVKSPRRTTRYS
ncbi:hypothetical protein AVEN_81696-1 [Araneus ventricosus]|uniref:Uncharacterized protein n=1 Tax=Araneus ventricosus TaxID=182803 RepID=A0A4Y2K0J2_ARAVE|nr:hypothetical protein AVEN_81696-1 [Araneus ventricosus]